PGTLQRSSRSVLSPHPPTSELYTLSLHDALPISHQAGARLAQGAGGDQVDSTAGADGADDADGPGVGHCNAAAAGRADAGDGQGDRKSTRLNSSHQIISYAVFCLKKKNKY